MNRSMQAWGWVRVLGGVTILSLLGWHLGTGPFVDGVRAVGLRSTSLAVVIAGATTVACAWRWCAVAAGLGVELSLPHAIAAYYRSQFLNTVLPGGVIGDVHRGFDHGRAVGRVDRGLRSVMWERVAGQLVQLVIAGLVLAVLPSPIRPALPLVLAASGVLTLLIAVAVRFAPPPGISRTARGWHVARSDVRSGVLAIRVWPVITVGSLVALVGHVAVFVIAADAVGVKVTLPVLVPLALIVLVAAAVPTNIAGWGPREGVAAWAFAGAGLGGHQGIAAATAFGVLMFMATLPGALALAGAKGRRTGLPWTSTSISARTRRHVGVRDG